MVTHLARDWWLLTIRGVAGIVFGVGAFVWPGITLAALVLLFGSYVLVDGIFAVAAGIRMRQQLDRWWLVVLEGVAGIVLGVLTFLSPGGTVLVLVSFIAAWSIITGMLEIATAVRMRKLIENEWLLVVSGIVSLVFGVFLIALPDAGTLALVWSIGFYALIFGVLMLLFSFRLRGMRDIGRGQAVRAAQ